MPAASGVRRRHARPRSKPPRWRGGPRRTRPSCRSSSRACSTPGARQAFLPQVGWQGGYEWNGADFTDRAGGWIVGAEVRVNVFRGLADRARAAETTGGRDAGLGGAGARRIGHPAGRAERVASPRGGTCARWRGRGGSRPGAREPADHSRPLRSGARRRQRRAARRSRRCSTRSSSTPRRKWTSSSRPRRSIARSAGRQGRRAWNWCRFDRRVRAEVVRGIRLQSDVSDRVSGMPPRALC